jgi:MFS transporter, DHA1 family, multidrug resistance protein
MWPRTGPGAGPLIVRRAPEGRGRRVVRLAVIGGLSSFGPLSLDLYLPALPRVAGSLHASDGITQLSISGCLIGLAIGQFVFGPLGDRFGRRRPLLAGVFLWTATALTCALAPDVVTLITMRVIQGFGGAAGLVLGRAVIRDLYEDSALARAFAVVALLSNITPAVAPVAGGALLHVMSWRGLFLVLTGIGVVLIAGTVLYLPESLPPEARRTGGLRDIVIVAREVATDRRFTGPAVTLALASAMLFAYISVSSVVLQHEYGLSSSAFSGVFAINSAGIIIAGSATVRLLRRFPPPLMLQGALVAAVISTGALCAAVLTGGPLWTVLVPLFVCVSTVGVVFPTATNLAMLAHRDAAGAGSALLGGGQYAVGGLAGPVVSLAGNSAAAMSVAMAISAAAALTSYRVLGVGAPRHDEGARLPV